MINTYDALAIMALIDACHHSTAPKATDADAVKATAGVWAELFDRAGLQIDDLTEGVKRRAAVKREAPEPSEIIEHARMARAERVARERPAAPDERPDLERAYREAVSDALAARDADDDPTEHARHVAHCVAVIAGHRRIPWQEAAEWVESKRARVQDRYRQEVDGEHMAQRPRAATKPGTPTPSTTDEPTDAHGGAQAVSR